MRLPRRLSLLVFVVGLAVTALYYVLDALDVGKVGAPTDIGGGLNALVGYLTVGVGVLKVVRDLCRSRS